MSFVAAFVSFMVGLCFAIPAFVTLLVKAIFNPKIFRRVERKVPPKCLTDPTLGEHHYVTTASKLKFHYVANGNPSKPLMLCLHGFPEFWYSYRHQLRAFHDKYRVVAVDLRGYGESAKPEGVSQYATKLLIKDVKEIVEALGYSSCILVAHDWGGAIAWHVPSAFPELVDKLIILNAPHFSVFKKYLYSHFSQMKKSWYMCFFQVPYIPEMFLASNDMEAFKIFRNKKKPGMFTDEDIEAWKYTFGKPGSFTPPLNYYRNIFSSSSSRSDAPKTKISVPVMVVWGTADLALEKEMNDGLDQYVEDLTIRYIEGASHWVQQDEPELVNMYIQEFLDTK
ncbi:epoxide hydrolase 4 [Nematostella vectensis]|uniref:epoxide hydrolase 4 n=1 Tax=Nematostella vectensis TaxID=45351 RepID=UPI00139000F9|nr:epoxide hydrolase 4 [Nematostella vectensis]